MINKTNLKYYLLPAGVLLIIFLIILIVPMGNKKDNEQVVTPTAFPSQPTKIPTKTQRPTPFETAQENAPSPTLIPLRFTGGDLTELPPEVKQLADQRTQLRRKTPLTLPFGTISFDYENDQFILSLNSPTDQSQETFTSWLSETYPAIPIEQFAIQ